MCAVLPYGCADSVCIVRMRVDGRAAAGMVRSGRMDHGGRSCGGVAYRGSDRCSAHSARGTDAAPHGDHPAGCDLQNFGEGEKWTKNTVGGWCGEIRCATDRARYCWWTGRRRWRTTTDTLMPGVGSGPCTFQRATRGDCRTGKLHARKQMLWTGEKNEIKEGEKDAENGE